MGGDGERPNLYYVLGLLEDNRHDRDKTIHRSFLLAHTFIIIVFKFCIFLILIYLYFVDTLKDSILFPLYIYELLFLTIIQLKLWFYIGSLDELLKVIFMEDKSSGNEIIWRRHSLEIKAFLLHQQLNRVEELKERWTFYLRQKKFCLKYSLIHAPLF